LQEEEAREQSEPGAAGLGRVRTEMVKKIAKELLQTSPDRFSTNYEENKKVVDELVNSKTKRVRNRIAGYVTRLRIVETQRLSGTLAETTAPPEESEHN